MTIREKLVSKIKADTGLVIPFDSTIRRRTLTWQHLSAGNLKWAFMIPSHYREYSHDQRYIGSQETMKELLASPKITAYSHAGQTELASS